jgi:DHA1 family bicyclomycin/chloramphenicol resistance-like MFS transporter
VTAPSAGSDAGALIPFLAALSALGPLSNDLYVPSLPLVSEALGASGGAVQLTMSSLLIGFSLGALIHGPLSDRYGRKPILLIGLAVYIVACVLSAYSGSLGFLIASRFVQGLGAAAAMVLSRAIILDRWSGAEASRAISWVAMFTFLTPVIAPVVGGYVASWGMWPAVFWLQAAAGVLCLAVTALFLPRVRKAFSGTLIDSVLAYGAILRDRQAVGYMTCSGLGFIGVIAFVTNSSFVLIEDFGLEPHHYGYGFSAVMLGGSVGAFLNSRLVRRLGISAMLGIGSALLGVGGATLILAVGAGGRLLAVLIPSLIYMLGVGFVFANTMARTLGRFPKQAGAASSLFAVVQFLIGALVAAGLSLVDTPTPYPLAGTMAVAGLGCASVWWSWLRRIARG